MRPDQLLSHWNHYVAILRRKWFAFSGGIIEAISQEEMRICREELDQRIVSNNDRGESRGT
jgi:hypothetical protein